MLSSLVLIRALGGAQSDEVDGWTWGCGCSLCRGVASINKLYGNKMAVLAGDFLLARASVSLARLRDVEVVELLSTVIEHLVKGEVSQ